MDLQPNLARSGETTPTLIPIILYIKALSPSVCDHWTQRKVTGKRKVTVDAEKSDATVLRFNPPAEPARTVGRTDRFCMGEPARTDGLCIISTNARWSVCERSLKVFHPPKLGALFDFANFQIPGT